MGKILGIGKFPEHGKINGDDDFETILEIDEGVYGDKVVLLPLVGNEEIKIGGFENRVGEIIEQIITDGIQDYLSNKAETETLESKDSQELSYKARNLVNETSKLARDMLLQAQAIEDTIEYIENTVDLEEDDIGENYIFKAIKVVLEPYKIRIFELLIKNEKKLTRNKKGSE